MAGRAGAGTRMRRIEKAGRPTGQVLLGGYSQGQGTGMVNENWEGVPK